MRAFNLSIMKSERIVMKIKFILLILCFAGCRSEEPKPLKIPHTVLTEHVYTRLPGRLILHKQYLVWQDPFASKDFIKIIDTQSGEQAGEAGCVGKGPEEFVTPSVGNCFDNKIVIYDLNSPKQAFFSIDSIINRQKYYIPLPLASTSRKFPIIAVDSSSFISVNDSLASSLQFIRRDSVVQTFGYPVITGDFYNRPDYFQANLFYDAYNGCLLCLRPYLSHISLYKNNGEEFSLYSRKQPARYDYSVENHQIKIKEPDTKILDVAFTRDYVVTIEINKENTRSTSGLPSIIRLYDYRFRLQHIIDLEIPLLRLAADSRSNTLYAMAVQDGYSVIQCSLPARTH